MLWWQKGEGNLHPIIVQPDLAQTVQAPRSARKKQACFPEKGLFNMQHVTQAFITELAVRKLDKDFPCMPSQAAVDLASRHRCILGHASLLAGCFICW